MGILFDDDLVALGRHLSALGSAPELAGVDAELAGHLRATAELVRPDWEEEDRRNRAWVAALEPALAGHGKAIEADLSAIYQAPWPKGPIRVDVSRFAGPVGAYTVLDPVHTTISSGNPLFTGAAALEMIFHEVSHALVDPIEKRLDAESARRGARAPRDLWHALLFYSTGEIVKRHVGPDYVPYATKNGLWARGWTEFEAALEKDWKPYLDGKVGIDAAIQALVGDVLAAPPAGS